MSILHSRRGNIEFLERAKLYTEGATVYISQEAEGRGPKTVSCNLPHKNTSFLLLGNGCSITSSAMNLLSDSGVVVGFASTGGTRLRSAIDPVFSYPQDDYRTPEYQHAWAKLFLDEAARLNAAKKLQAARARFTKETWDKLEGAPVSWPVEIFESDLSSQIHAINQCRSTEDLLSLEGRTTRSIYQMAASAYGQHEFTRIHEVSSEIDVEDPNALLTNGNYMAYGCAAVACWVLGIPQGMPLMHGKTRRGGLIFDVADLIKDAIVIPHAFSYAARARKKRLSDRKLTSFQVEVIDSLHRFKALDFMIDEIKKLLK